jgi:hypothetical protein
MNFYQLIVRLIISNQLTSIIPAVQSAPNFSCQFHFTMFADVHINNKISSTDNIDHLLTTLNYPKELRTLKLR